uniref:Uncharacterized protein n=1 Tax=Peronospora matthiolae TaxID=2874970 RepID=A0AAV1TMQ6_9STRA
MRVYYFALALCAALAGVTITASEPAESAIPLGSVHDAAKHQDGVHFERSLMAAEATNHEARSPVGEDLMLVVEPMAPKVKSWAERFAQLVTNLRLRWEVKALAKQIRRQAVTKEDPNYSADFLIRLMTAEQADGLATLYMKEGKGDTPEVALANVLAGTYGDEAMVRALITHSFARESVEGMGVGRVQSAMIARWEAGDCTLETMIKWILGVDSHFPDHQFFNPVVFKLLSAAGSASSPDVVYKALFKHFGNDVRRFADVLEAAESRDFHDHKAVRECARWLESWQKVNLNGAAMI